jgi:uncharacterized protein (TIGR03085 family)
VSIASRERAATAELLAELGPDAPTLCEGWSTRDLAAHLAVRERRPDATPGIAVSALSGWTERVQTGYAERPYEELVELVRTGPGLLSPFALPGWDRFFNTTEYVVHHEDVRRAQPGWAPRDLPRQVQDSLWKAVRARAPLAFRSSAAGVVLRRSGAARSRVVAAKGEPVATVTGEPLELLLYVFGRRDHAVVDVTGEPAAIAALTAASLEV